MMWGKTALLVAVVCHAVHDLQDGVSTYPADLPDDETTYPAGLADGGLPDGVSTNPADLADGDLPDDATTYPGGVDGGLADDATTYPGGVDGDLPDDATTYPGGVDGDLPDDATTYPGGVDGDLPDDTTSPAGLADHQLLEDPWGWNPIEVPEQDSGYERLTITDEDLPLSSPLQRGRRFGCTPLRHVVPRRGASYRFFFEHDDCGRGSASSSSHEPLTSAWWEDLLSNSTPGVVLPEVPENDLLDEAPVSEHVAEAEAPAEQQAATYEMEAEADGTGEPDAVPDEEPASDQRAAADEMKAEAEATEEPEAAPEEAHASEDVAEAEAPAEEQAATYDMSAGAVFLEEVGEDSQTPSGALPTLLQEAVQPSNFKLLSDQRDSGHDAIGSEEELYP